MNNIYVNQSEIDQATNSGTNQKQIYTVSGDNNIVGKNTGSVAIGGSTVIDSHDNNSHGQAGSSSKSLCDQVWGWLADLFGKPHRS